MAARFPVPACGYLGLQTMVGNRAAVATLAAAAARDGAHLQRRFLQKPGEVPPVPVGPDAVWEALGKAGKLDVLGQAGAQRQKVAPKRTEASKTVAACHDVLALFLGCVSRSGPKGMWLAYNALSSFGPLGHVLAQVDPQLSRVQAENLTASREIR